MICPAASSPKRCPAVQQLGRVHHSGCAPRRALTCFGRTDLSLPDATSPPSARPCRTLRGVRGPMSGALGELADWPQRMLMPPDGARGWLLGSGHDRPGEQACREPAPPRCVPAPGARCSLQNLPSAMASAILPGWSRCRQGARLISQPRPFFLPPPSPQAFPWGSHIVVFLRPSWPLAALPTLWLSLVLTGI